MRVVDVVVLVAVLAFAAYLLLTSFSRTPPPPAARWEVATRTREDGTYVVAVRGEGGEHVVRELPAGLEGAELTAELRLAREEAQAQADELNR